MRILDYEIVNVVSDKENVKIFKAKNSESFFAIKLVNTENEDSNFSNYRLDINNENIVKCYAIIEEFTYLDKKYVLFILEWLNGETLREYIHKKGRFELESYKKILKGISFLHKSSIYHRDIKPENIMMVVDDTQNIHPKIIDYDSQFVRDSSKHIVTVEYAHPHYESVSIKECDIWAIGCLTYEMITKNILFKGNAEGIKKRRISLEDLKNIPEPYRYICYRCFYLKSEKIKIQEIDEILEIIQYKQKFSLKLKMLKTYLFS